MTRVFFDVDDTLLTWDRHLRPFTAEVFASLARAGFELYVWSGVGRRREFVDVYELRPYVLDCYEKPLSRHRERLEELGIPFVPDYVVDDDEEIVQVFGGIHLPGPLEPLVGDRELLRVLRDLERRLPDHFDHRRSDCRD